MTLDTAEIVLGFFGFDRTVAAAATTISNTVKDNTQNYVHNIILVNF
jgi:hypothetical protein